MLVTVSSEQKSRLLIRISILFRTSCFGFRPSCVHYIFGQMELAEEQGLGIKSMRTEAVEPFPQYEIFEVALNRGTLSNISPTFDASTLASLGFKRKKLIDSR